MSLSEIYESNDEITTQMAVVVAVNIVTKGSEGNELNQAKDIVKRYIFSKWNFETVPCKGELNNLLNTK